jgi:hypothetical protein
VTPYRDEDCLAYDPFSGDRDVDVTEFSDKFVVTRKQHKCNVCAAHIPPRTRVRAKTERDNDDQVVMTFYFCPSCCEAMAASWTDNGKAIESRTALGMRSAGFPSVEEAS